MSAQRQARVTIAGHEFWLRPTEHRLLDVLAADPGRIFTRAELIACVMPSSVVLERTIDVHIKELRQKLGPLGDTIQTVRRGGYMYALPESGSRQG